MDYDRIDWNHTWKHQIRLWHDAAGKSCEDIWGDENSARVYAEKHGKHNEKRINQTLDYLNITSDFKVLDIGAGPGNIAIPMAQVAHSVTTVEPSHGMNAVMEKEMVEKEISNLVRIEKKWEEVDPDKDLNGPYDIVLASMSLGMENIKISLEKMSRVCSGRVVIFWHAGTPEWEKMPKALWPNLFGKAYHGGPKSDVLFQVLYQMGIYPEVKAFKYHFTEVFPDLDNAADFYYRRFKQLTPEHRPQLLDYLKKECGKTDKGYVHGFDHQTMRFSWEPKEVRHEVA
ncbi:MAG: class I SAM-dependent methyltransferase [Desulfobacterales bacterium]|nr:class I SAM-dependent methyltransferase [Desulfobacterales bacterium]